ncbi:MAG: DNA polymerase III subunit delta [Eggerthellaceae bacterium]|nr:DNA polymerase III subunit delta [Eggerthellaceae bacterium]
MANSKQQPLLPAYLVTGTDELKRQVVVARLRKRVAQEGDISFNSDTFSGEAATGEDIVSACNTLPFASNVRLVHVDVVDKLKKDDQERLIAYLESPSETTVLCLVASGLAKNTRLYKAVAKLGSNAIIDCSPPKLRELPNQVRSMAVSHGATITHSAASLLVDLVGENTVALDAELKKLSLAHRGNDPINDSEVASLVSRTSEAKPWEFVDAFSARNLSKCVVLRSHMESTSPHALLAMCVTRLRELIAARCLSARGQASSLSSYLHVPDWRVKNHQMWARGFTSEELRRALATARDTERAMKSGADPEAAFQQWFIEVAKAR